MNEDEPARQRSRRKRHHYVSVTYLKSWADGAGKVHAYIADEGSKHLHLRPDEIGFENYYYSQTLEDGSRDHDSFEELFGAVETHWPHVLRQISAGEPDPATLRLLYMMVTMMRTRVPAARDYNEELMALETRTTFKAMHDMGRLPAKLARYENELDTVEITINRQRTLETMGEDMRRFGDLTLGLGFEMLRNETGIKFLTSDNPVSYFDASDKGIARPYFEGRQLELFFPASPELVLHGSTRLRSAGHSPSMVAVRDPAKIRRINRITARFAYRLMFAPDRSEEDLIQRHAPHSPVLDAHVVCKPAKIEYHVGHKFAARPVLPKFKPEECEGDLYEEDFE